MAWKVGECLLPELLRLENMTQQQLADKTGLKQQTISKYTTNKEKMSYKNARLIANALKRPMESLYRFYWVDD